MTQATSNEREILVRSAIQTDSNDRFFQSAFLKMTAHIKRPGGRKRWIFDQTAFGTYKPWRHLTEPMQLAMDANAPEEDVMAMVHCLAGLVHAHYAAKETATDTVKEALRLAIHTGSDEMAVDSDAICNLSASTVEKVLEAAVREERCEENVVEVCQRWLGQTLGGR